MSELNIVLREAFLEHPDSMFTELRDSIEWDERMNARKTASFGVPYDYSGITYPQTEMPSCLLPVCKKIAQEIGFTPNNCLMNFYLDGNSTMGFHSDSTQELEGGTGVAIISLGAERHICYRSKEDKQHKVTYLLKNGALLYMDSLVQDNWMHAIPKEPGSGERISLTFRHIVM